MLLIFLKDSTIFGTENEFLPPRAKNRYEQRL